MEKLTPQEEEAMLFIWKASPCFIKDVLALYPEPKPPYTTLASIVKNLERKGYVKGRQMGNTNQYTPLVDEGDYKRSFLSGVVHNYFQNSYKELVSFFASEQKLSPGDLKEIIEMIEKGKL
jgi:predicted transcriptional regulator